MQKIKTEVDKRQHLAEAFDGLTIRSHDSTPDIKTVTPPRVWLGYVLSDKLKQEYVQARHRLAEAAYIGDWQTVKKYILRGESEWGETWANAFRLRRSPLILMTC